MDVTQSYTFTRFGAMDVTKPYEFIGFGAASTHLIDNFWSDVVGRLGPNNKRPDQPLV